MTKLPYCNFKLRLIVILSNAFKLLFASFLKHYLINLLIICSGREHWVSKESMYEILFRNIVPIHSKSLSTLKDIEEACKDVFFQTLTITTMIQT